MKKLSILAIVATSLFGMQVFAETESNDNREITSETPSNEQTEPVAEVRDEREITVSLNDDEQVPVLLSADVEKEDGEIVIAS